MKICHVIYIPRLSGAEILVRDLTAAHSTHENQISVVSIEPAEDSFRPILKQFEALNVDLFIPQNKLSKVGRLKHLIQNLRRLSPDIIITHAVIPSAYVRLALRVARLNSVAVVSVLHDASQDDFASPYFRLIERFLQPADVVIPLTENALNNYRRRCGDRSKTEIIPNGINLEALLTARVNRQQVREKIYQVSPTEVVILQIGRFTRSKQQHLSIAAFIQACHSGDKFQGKLFMAGLVEDQAYFDDLQNQVLESQYKEKIVFLGPRSNVPELLSGADIFLMPSKREAHSIAFLEALAAGITMIISDIPAFELRKQFLGVHALNPELKKEFAKLILKTAKDALTKRWDRDLQRFSMEETSAAYLKLFKTLVDA